MIESSRTYLPAAGRDWLLPFYDPIVKLLGGEAARKQLLEQARLHPGQRVLDVGCGTGTLAVLIKRIHPKIEVVGLDPDPKALTRAGRKAARAAVSIQFDQGFGDRLPYSESSFDCVFSSFMYHHVPSEERGKLLTAVRRILKPAGEFHLMDCEGPQDHPRGFLANLVHSNHHLSENSEARVLETMRRAGFSEASKTGRRTMLFGGVAYYWAHA
jgi:ubiquinone/menaquinone biosynthesis C-methylase UbiE